MFPGVIQIQVSMLCEFCASFASNCFKQKKVIKKSYLNKSINETYKNAQNLFGKLNRLRSETFQSADKKKKLKTYF